MTFYILSCLDKENKWINDDKNQKALSFFVELLYKWIPQEIIAFCWFSKFEFFCHKKNSAQSNAEKYS